MKVTSEFLESLFCFLRKKNYNGVCCINSPIIAVFLDQKSFPYMLISTSYDFDFLDHFMELDISKNIDPSRNFDMLICDTSDIDMPIRLWYKILKTKFLASKEKVVLVDICRANRFIQSNLFRPSNSDFKNLISKDTIALSL